MFINGVSISYPVAAVKRGSNIVIDKRDEFIIKKVMKRYYDMEYVAYFFDKRTKKDYLVFCYNGDMSDSKIIEVRGHDAIIINGGINDEELSKLPEDNVWRYI